MLNLITYKPENRFYASFNISVRVWIETTTRMGHRCLGKYQHDISPHMANQALPILLKQETTIYLS